MLGKYNIKSLRFDKLERNVTLSLNSRNMRVGQMNVSFSDGRVKLKNAEMR